MDWKLLLVLPFNATLFSQTPCLIDSFYGAYNLNQATVGIFQVSTPECIESSHQSFSGDTNNLIYDVPYESSFVWLEQEDVDQALLQQEPFNVDQFQLSLAGLVSQPQLDQQGQQTFETKSVDGPMDTLLSSEKAMLVSLPRPQALSIDTILPRFWKSTLVPDTPSTYRTMSEDLVAPLRQVLETLRFNPDVAAIVNNISLPQIHKDIRVLTGEDDTLGIVSRHSFSSGALAAADWIKEQIEGTGATCRLYPFLEGFAPNVIWYLISFDRS